MRDLFASMLRSVKRYLMSVPGPARIYYDIDHPKGGHHRGVDIYYECRRCGDVIPSIPPEGVHCTCRNITIDASYVRIGFDDISQVRVFSSTGDVRRDHSMMLLNEIPYSRLIGVCR